MLFKFFRVFDNETGEKQQKKFPETQATSVPKDLSRLEERERKKCTDEAHGGRHELKHKPEEPSRVRLLA